MEPIILVRNEVTVNNRFDFWEDVDGEFYNFPNGMKGLITEGRPFIYYRGVHRKDGTRGPAEYLGTGIVGAVEQIHLPAYKGSLPTWRCGIEEYIPFPRPVPAKTKDGKYLENIPKNQWAKVRRTASSVFHKIIELSSIAHGANPEIPAGEYDLPIFPLVEQTTPVLIPSGTVLLKRKPIGGKNTCPPGTLRRSKYSKALGDRAEEVALKYLSLVLPPSIVKTLRWVADDGQTPGWDIQYGPRNKFIAVEVKGTSGHHFAAVELTAREWEAAKQLRSRFLLMLVSQCKSATPLIEIIEDPFGLHLSGEIVTQPLSWRLERSAS